MKFIVPIKKGAFLEIAMNDVDDNLMNIREQIFNELIQKEISTVNIKVDFTYFENKDSEPRNENCI